MDSAGADVMRADCSVTKTGNPQIQYIPCRATEKGMLHHFKLPQLLNNQLSTSPDTSCPFFSILAVCFSNTGKIFVESSSVSIES